MGHTTINIDVSIPDIPVYDAKGLEVSPESRLLTPEAAAALRPPAKLTNAMVDALNAALVAGDVDMLFRASLGLAAPTKAALESAGWQVAKLSAGAGEKLMISMPAPVDPADPVGAAQGGGKPPKVGP